MRWTLTLAAMALVCVTHAPSVSDAAPPPREANAAGPAAGKPAPVRQSAPKPTAGKPAARQVSAGNAMVRSPAPRPTTQRQTHQAAQRQAGSRSPARPAASRQSGRIHAVRASGIARPQTAHPGLAGSGEAASAFCGHMGMPAEELRQVSRGYSRGHVGIDLMAPHGSPVRAAAAGVVIYAGWYYAYGNMVDIRHADGVVTRYAHLSAFSPETVPGAAVQAGAEIGKVGATGRAHGAHVHFEVRVDGHALDPKPYLALAGCTDTGPREEILEAFAPAQTRGSARRSTARQARH